MIECQWYKCKKDAKKTQKVAPANKISGPIFIFKLCSEHHKELMKAFK